MADPMYNHPELPTKRRFETDVKYEVATVPPFEEYNNVSFKSNNSGKIIFSKGVTFPCLHYGFAL